MALKKKIDLHTVNPRTEQVRRRDDWRAEDARRVMHYQWTGITMSMCKRFGDKTTVRYTGTFAPTKECDDDDDDDDDDVFFFLRSFLAAEGPLTQGCCTGQPPGTDCFYTGQSPDVLVVGKV